MIYDQSEFQIRCEWGAQGVAQLAPISDVVIIVDVLSFTTGVEVAASRGALIFPYRYLDETARAFAEAVRAELADRRDSHSRFSLSPASLWNVPAGTRLVLPSPNGSTLTLATGNTPTLAGCLRNARAVARAAQRFGNRIAVVPAGERWTDGSLRPAIEDWIGAGAIINALNGVFSPEALGARGTYLVLEAELKSVLQQCSSGKELIAKGFAEDVEIASMVDVSETAPLLRDGAYSAWDYRE
jgi:2-phosphosulfolactate phosphatase